ncbi:MAG: DUF3093 domain-containing protein [Propionibacteriaceae bacterium]|nr:DUF3093 domain-containing protein [Propionibacteriaceae bacterium]
MSYVERLRVPMWWWIVAVVLVASLALAVLAYVPTVQGIIVVALSCIAVGLMIHAYGSTSIRVADGALHVGRQSLEGRWIEDVEALDRAESTQVMSSGASTRDFLLTRPYIGELVRVKLNDAADPHPHWLVSSRNATQLAAALDTIKRSP